MAKSAAFGVVHLGLSFSIGWLLTGSVAIAGAITLVEPLANTVAHYFFDRWWARRAQGPGGAGRGRRRGGPRALHAAMASPRP
jgi:uncharacterized membrane protein